MRTAQVPEPLTRSVEDYLKVIYRLCAKGRHAATSDIADRLGLSAPSVSGMIKRLTEQGLLEHLPYRGTELTREGRRIALRMLRRHRLIEAYLVAFLGFGWDNVHEEAERLEHAVSDTLIDRMAAALGNPRFDPHGDPIPDADGSISELVYTPLAELAPGDTAEIRQVDTSNPDRLRYIASFGLVPGAVVVVEDVQPFHGPITLRVGGKRKVIGSEIGCLLLCSRRGAAGVRA